MNYKSSAIGGCMCGAVRYTGIGEPIHIGYCHCRSCRLHSGAAVAGMLVYEPDKIQITLGKLEIYESSLGVERGFCGQCGTTLTWQGRGLASIHIGTLDDPSSYPPTVHWRWEERNPWFNECLTLPHVDMVYPDP